MKGEKGEAHRNARSFQSVKTYNRVRPSMSLKSPVNPAEIPIHPGLRMMGRHFLCPTMGAGEISTWGDDPFPH